MSTKTTSQQATHTPGPWQADDNARHYFSSDPYFVDVYANDAKPGDKLPAQALGSTRERAVANARLIAAAPELAKACREIMRAWARGDDPGEFGGHPAARRANAILDPLGL